MHCVINNPLNYRWEVSTISFCAEVLFMTNLSLWPVPKIRIISPLGLAPCLEYTKPLRRFVFCCISWSRHISNQNKWHRVTSKIISLILWKLAFRVGRSYTMLLLNPFVFGRSKTFSFSSTNFTLTGIITSRVPNMNPVLHSIDGQYYDKISSATFVLNKCQLLIDMPHGHNQKYNSLERYGFSTKSNERVQK